MREQKGDFILMLIVDIKTIVNSSSHALMKTKANRGAEI